MQIREKNICFFYTAFLSQALIGNKTNKTFKVFVFSEVAVGQAQQEWLKQASVCPGSFFLTAPLKVSFVAPDVLCSYLFSL